MLPLLLAICLALNVGVMVRIKLNHEHEDMKQRSAIILLPISRRNHPGTWRGRRSISMRIENLSATVWACWELVFARILFIRTTYLRNCGATGGIIQMPQLDSAKWSSGKVTAQSRVAWASAQVCAEGDTRIGHTMLKLVTEVNFRWTPPFCTKCWLFRVYGRFCKPSQYGLRQWQWEDQRVQNQRMGAAHWPCKPRELGGQILLLQKWCRGSLFPLL